MLAIALTSDLSPFWIINLVCAAGLLATTQKLINKSLGGHQDMTRTPTDPHYDWWREPYGFVTVLCIVYAVLFGEDKAT